MTLSSAMNIKEFEEKYHQHFANPEEEAKAAATLAINEAQINKQHEEYVQGKANFDEGNQFNKNTVFINLVFRFETFGAHFSTQIPCNSVQSPMFRTKF